MTKTGQWLADWMAEDGAIDRLPEGWDDPHALIQKIEAEAAGEPDQCTDRCEGRIGHPGYHQSSDHAAIIREATAAAEQRLAGLNALIDEWADDDAPTWVEQVPYLVRSEVVSRLRALSGTPPPASPRQGEPVDVERLSIAMNRAYTYGTGTAEQVATAYAALSEPTEAET